MRWEVFVMVLEVVNKSYNKGTKSILLFLSLISCFSIITGCNKGGINFGDMESAEHNFHERQSKALVAYMSLETMFPNDRVRALAKAAGKGKTKEIEELVSQGVNVNTPGYKNATILFWAMKSNSYKGFKKLLELGADPNVIFDDGGTVMHWAVRNKSQSYLKSALENGGNPNLIAGSIFKQTPLYEAIGIFGEIGNTPYITTLLEAGADVNARRSNGDFPVIVAANLGRFDIVHELLQQGADYKVTNTNGQNLTNLIVSKRKVLNTDSELFEWLEKVEVWLKEQNQRGHIWTRP